MKNLTKEQVAKAAQKHEQTLASAKRATLIAGFALVLFAMWGVVFNTDVPAENYAIVLMVGALTLGIGGIKR